MSGFMTPKAAKDKWCPGAGGDEDNCIVEFCPAWRWLPIQANDPRFIAAVKAEQQSIGGTGKHKEAVAAVMANPEKHGVPTAPEKGWCGLGGKPEV